MASRDGEEKKWGNEMISSVPLPTIKVLASPPWLIISWVVDELILWWCRCRACSRSSCWLASCFHVRINKSDHILWSIIKTLFFFLSLVLGFINLWMKLSTNLLIQKYIHTQTPKPTSLICNFFMPSFLFFIWERSHACGYLYIPSLC